MKGYVDTPDGQIHYREAGEGEPLLLLHQAPSSSAMWEPLLPALAARGYRAIALDLPGHGTSDPPASPPELADYARAILAAARGLGLDRFAVLGHHTGGSVALTMAVEHPEHVSRIVVYGVALLDEERARTLAEEEPPVFEPNGDAAVKTWRSMWGYAPAGHEATVAARGVVEALITGVNRPYGHNAVGRADHGRLIDELRVPMLALAGRKEMLHAESQRAAERSPWVTFQELGDAGIFVADECPEELARAVDEFLRSPAPAPEAAAAPA